MKRLFFPLLALIVLSACDRTNPEPAGRVEIGIRPLSGESAFLVNSPYNNLQGRAFQVENLQIYLSDLALVNSEGKTVSLYSATQDEPVWLWDFGKLKVLGGESYVAGGEATGTIRAAGFKEVPVGSYTSLKATFGVPKSFNHLDPTTFPTAHPLSEVHGAFWTWTSGYIFLKMDGQFDDSPAGNDPAMNGSLTYHLGLDSLRRELVLDGLNLQVTEDATSIVDLDFYLDKLFYWENDTIDMVVDHLTHTTNDFDLATRMTRNLANHAFELR